MAEVNNPDGLPMIRPVFLKEADTLEEELTVRGLCGAAESVTGYNTIDGAQNIRGLWRIYPKSEDARTELLLNGLTISGRHMTLWDKNPFILREDNGEEIPTTRLTISDIPLSYSNEDIIKALENIGCRFMSKLIFECDRDEHKRLTRWKTGRRFAYIAIPPVPLVRSLRVGLFEARLYHKEQKVHKSQVECFNCLQPGHISRVCVNPVRCKVCRLEGHRAGDMECRLVPSASEAQRLEDGEIQDPAARDDGNAKSAAMPSGQAGTVASNGDNHDDSDEQHAPIPPRESGSQRTPPTGRKSNPIAKWILGNNTNKKDKRNPPTPEEKPVIKAKKTDEQRHGEKPKKMDTT